MENFFERVGRVWPAGRRDLHWHILPTLAEAAAIAAPYKDLLPRRGWRACRWTGCTARSRTPSA